MSFFTNFNKEQNSNDEYSMNNNLKKKLDELCVNYEALMNLLKSKNNVTQVSSNDVNTKKKKFSQKAWRTLCNAINKLDKEGYTINIFAKSKLQRQNATIEQEKNVEFSKVQKEIWRERFIYSKHFVLNKKSTFFKNEKKNCIKRCNNTQN